LFNDFANNNIQTESKQIDLNNIQIDLNNIQTDSNNIQTDSAIDSEQYDFKFIKTKTSKTKTPASPVSRMQTPKTKTTKIANSNETNDDDIFSTDNYTEINGKNKLILMNKIKQYKTLFKTELKGFTIKKNSTEEELKNYLSEIEIIINLNTLDNFCSDSIILALKSVENYSTLTKYDISGTAEILQQNPKFHALVKQLYLKYNLFSNVPPEYQLIMLFISTSAYSFYKNKQKNDDFFNKPIN
jgi:hypothetical protein